MGINILRVLFSLLFLGAGLYLGRSLLLTWMEVRRWRREGVVVEGTVVGFKEQTLQSRRSYTAGPPPVAPIVEYKTGPSDQTRSFISAFASTSTPYTLNQLVEVRYLPSDPSAAELDSVSRGYLVLLLLLLPTLVCLLIASLPILLKPK